MDEEMITLQVEEENGEVVNVEDITLNIEQEETIEYIKVDEPEKFEIEIEEAVSPAGIGDGNYAPLEHTHPIKQVEELSGILNNLALAKDYHSIHSGFAEFRQWLDDGYYKKNYLSTGGVGYFVSLITDGKNNTYIDICNKKNADNVTDVNDIYGVTVANSGFYGYQADTYNILDSTSRDLSDDFNYAKVCLLGTVKVRMTSEDHLNINVGDYVVPNELGHAQKSENNVGFKVISKGQIESVGSTTTAWYYVEIALIPQNDNVARVMKKIEDTQVNLEGISIQLGTMSDEFEGMKDSNIQLGKDFDGLKDLVNESTDQIKKQLPTIEDMLQDAKDIASEANKTINNVALEYAEAVNGVNKAQEDVKSALATVNQIKQELNPLAQWKEDGTSNIAGFVAQANADSTTLASITQAYGTDLTGIIQKIDENGATIQHLVTHVDKYTLGEYSPSYGLSAEETVILQPGIIYVPTKSHLEEVEFERGMSYIWKIGDTPDVYTWVEYKPVSTDTDEISGTEDGDLWYCWQGIINGNQYIYSPGTLYRWDNMGSGLWVAVASVNDKSARAIGLLNQTAEKLTSVYTNLQKDMSIIEQDVTEIRALVGSTESGSLSLIEQAAERIMMGIYNADGSSSLGLLLDGMTSNAINANVIKIKTVEEAPPTGMDKYNYAPVWNGKEFIPVGDPSQTGEYYFDPKDTQPYTYYCRVISSDSYAVYGVNNVAMANLNTRVSNTESEVESWTRFQKGQNETMTSINQTSDEDGAAISSMVFGKFRKCVEINLELADEDKATISTNRYDKQPVWEDDKFVFEGNKKDLGEYCLPIGGDGTCYYKLLYRDTEVVGYEKYEMKASNYTAILQEVDENGSIVGLKAGNDDVDGEIFVRVINNQTNATISADKIDLQGYVTIESLSGEGTTTINGSNITTGIIKSHNYLSPVEGNIFAQKGTKFDLTDGSINSTNFNLSTDGNVSITGEITARSGYIGNDINGFIIQKNDSVYTYTVGINGLSEGVYYFKHDGKYYSFEIIEELIEDTIINVNCSLGTTNIGDEILTESEEIPTDATLLSFKDVTHYYLGNNQSSYSSDGSGSAGVYIGPDGIGLGNGNFYIDNLGHLTTSGEITMKSNGEDVVVIDTKGNLALGGNIMLDGNIMLNGNITWGDSKSFVRVLYARSKNQGKPTENYDSYDDDYKSSTVWHKVYNEDYDRYASYSYDCGKTWEEPIKITGEDGDTVVNEVDYDTIYDMLLDSYGITSTYIDGTTVQAAQIQAPVITGAQIMGADIIGGSFHAIDNVGFMESLYEGVSTISSDASAYYLWKKNNNGESLQGFIGYDRGIDDPVLGYKADPAVYFSTLDGCNLKIMAAGNMSIGAGQIVLSGSELRQEGTVYFMSNVVFNEHMTIDFANCKIDNWNGPSGSNEAVFG